jgi:LCP family protein required for cell wall assembly
MSQEQGDDRPPERPEGSERPEEPDSPEEPKGPEKPERPDRPEYTVYGAGGRKLGRKRAPKRQEPESEPAQPEGEGEHPALPEEPAGPAAPAGRPRRTGKPEYRVYRSRPSLRDRLRKPDFRQLRRPSPGLRGRLAGIGRRRWLVWVLVAIGAWVLISFIAFAISAEIQKGKLPDSAKQALEGGPDVLAGQNILILGGDRRGERQAQASGVEAQGPPRADTIMVLHAALTSFRKLSIPRDTYAAIPECGEQRINASLACNTNSRDGNPASTIRTVENFLGIPIHHIVIIDFDGFADFINTLGGIEVKIKEKVCGDVDGGKKQGGVSIQLKAGEHTLEGDKALALARIRKNECQPDEDDTDRAARQQVILNGIKGRLTSPLRLPYNFIKGPWIGWNAPKAFISDMGGFTLPQVAIAAIFGGSGTSNVLGRQPDGDVTASPGPGGSIFISEGECRRAVEELTGGEPEEDPACSPG